MLKNVSSTLFVMVIAMLSSFVVTVFLGRILSVSDFGEYALLKQIILIGSTVAVFGLDFSYIKVFTYNPDSTRKTHLITLSIFFINSIIFVAVLKTIYDLQYYKLFYIFISICLGAINLYLAAIFRLKSRFLLAQIFAVGWKIVLLFLVGVAVNIRMSIDIKFIYQIFSISFFAFSSFIIYYLFRTYTSKDVNFELRNYLTYGITFWLINSTGLISGGIDKLVIPLIYDSETLGIFTGVSFIFTISLTIVGSAIGYVIFPKIAAGKHLNTKKLSLAIFIIAIIAIITFHFTGKELVSIIFSGKYDSYLDQKLILCFSLLGSFQIVHVVLHHILSGRGNKKQLLYYLILSILFIGLFIILLFVLKLYFTFSLIGLSIIILITRVIKIFSMTLLLKYIEK